MTDDEEIVGTVGACCDIWLKYMFGQPWYRFGNRCTGEGSSWDSNIQDAIDAANDYGNCYPAARVYFTLNNSVTKEQLSDVWVCVGLMCTHTQAAGETYLGQYAYGLYGLTAAAIGYENLVETITLDQTEYHLTRELVPTGAPEPGEGCDAWPSWARGICSLTTGLITASITALTTSLITPLQKFVDDAWKVTLDMYAVLENTAAGLAAEVQMRMNDIAQLTTDTQTWIWDGLKQTYDEVETNLISPLIASVDALWKDIGAVWLSIEEIVEKAIEEAAAWRKGITDLDASIRKWIENSIIDILICALDREVDGGKKTCREP